MAILPGFIVDYDSAMVQSDNRLATVLDELSEWDWPPVSGYVSDDITAGTLINNLVVEQEATQNLAGDTVDASFFADWYNTIHIVPNNLALGNLLSEQSREVEVWNAYLSSQLLSSIDEDSTDGLALSEPAAPPTAFATLESRIYTVQVSTTGPSSIDATLTFNFPSDAPQLIVTGNRVVIWPFTPNWRQPVEEVLEWLTDVIESDDGHEQGIRLRDAPQRRYSYLATARGADQRRMRALLWDWQARIYALPVGTDNGRLDFGAVAGALSLSVQTDYLDYHDGGLALLIGSTAQTESVEIDTVSPTKLTLVRELQQDWPAGARIYPALLARMSDRQPLTEYTSEIDEALYEFAIEGNQTIPDAELNATIYLGYPVLEQRPNWRENRTAEFQRRLQILDNQTGVKAVDDLSGLPATIQGFLWTKGGRADIYALRQWLHARAGRLNRIWVPTDQADLVLAEQADSTDNVIRVEHIGYTQYLHQAKGRRDICIRLKSGQRLYRRITSSQENSTTVEQLGIDSPLGITVPPDQVLKISWLQLTRMAADAVQLNWHSREVQECQHNLRSVLDDV